MRSWWTPHGTLKGHRDLRNQCNWPRALGLNGFGTKTKRADYTYGLQGTRTGKRREALRGGGAHRVRRLQRGGRVDAARQHRLHTAKGESLSARARQLQRLAVLSRD